MAQAQATGTMRAIVFDAPGRPLRAVEREIPEPAQGQLLLRVHACGICRTDLHLLDGELQIAQAPRVLGHQIVASVEAAGPPSQPRAGSRLMRPRGLHRGR